MRENLEAFSILAVFAFIVAMIFHVNPIGVMLMVILAVLILVGLTAALTKVFGLGEDNDILQFGLILAAISGALAGGIVNKLGLF